MAVDTPATIAILGAGPVGLEAGLYARYLGYRVLVFEQQEVCSHVLRWGHVRMFSSFVELRSTLGLAALRAQDPDYRPPDPAALLTGRAWADSYLLPLSRTDLLADEIQCDARVVAVSRESFPDQSIAQGDMSDDAPNDAGFRILVHDAQGRETDERADVVIDCTGVYGHPNWCGADGVPARGETAVRRHIEQGVPDLAGSARALYAGHHTLVVGDGLAAAATVMGLVKLARQIPSTQITWTTRRAAPQHEGPVAVTKYTGFGEQQRLAEEANRAAHSGVPYLAFRPDTTISAMDFDEDSEQFLVQFTQDATPARFDRIVANVGYRPDYTPYAGLQVARSPVTEGPAGLGDLPADAALADRAGRVALQPERLLTTEPNFYILGAKSFGRDSRFRLSDGLRQIRDLFGILGDRPALDLYATAEKLANS